jgi:sodium-dependent dicarboxylate transporter 2/3/5
MSNTATAALLIPILSVIAKSAESTLAPYGGESTLLLCIAISASLAMALPISTPPNALAHAQGTVSQDNMAKTGVILGVIGLAIAYLVFIYLGSVGLF